MQVKRVVALAALFVLVGAACRGGGGGGTSAGDISTDVGVEGRTIKVGELAPLTGPAALLGEALTLGHEVYWQYVNEELGGVGRDLSEGERFTVELVTRDTQYLPDKHVEQFNAIRDEVLAIGQSFGTPTTKAILPQLQDDPILTGPATLSAEWLPESYMFAAGAPYAVQYINAADYIVNELGEDPKAGIIYQDDDYGEEGLKGLEFAAEKFGFDVVAEATYKLGDQEFTAQVNTMKSNGADHVFLTAIPSAAGPIFGTAAQLGYTPRWIGQSPIWLNPVFRNPDLVPYISEHLLWVGDASCEWGQTGEGCEGMAEMVENLETYAPEQEPDIYFAFGYTQARILHEILEVAIGRTDLTRDGVITAFQSMRGVDIGGLLNPISYGPNCENRIPATASNIFEVDVEEPLAVKPIATVDSEAVDDFPFCP